MGTAFINRYAGQAGKVPKFYGEFSILIRMEEVPVLAAGQLTSWTCMLASMARLG